MFLFFGNFTSGEMIDFIKSSFADKEINKHRRFSKTISIMKIKIKMKRKTKEENAEEEEKDQDYQEKKDEL